MFDKCEVFPMGVKLNFYENNRVIELVVQDPWTITELTSLYPEEEHVYATAKHTVYTLVDLTAMQKIPPEALWHRRSPNVVNPRSGQIVIVGASPFAVAMAETAFRVMRFRRVKFFTTPDAAWNYLREVLADEDKQQGIRSGT
jgi:hypothetical protein